MKTLKLVFVTLLVMAIIMPTSVFAKDTEKAGKITAISGKAEVKKSGGSKKFNAFKGMAITKGDTILTGSDGKVTMDLDSDKEVTIGTDTTLVVSELVKSAKALGGKTSLSLLKGKVLVTIKKKLDGDSRFEIETPTAIMGVMGTQFTVAYENNESYLGVFEGAVKTKHGPGLTEETTVNPNEQLPLNKDGAGVKEKLNYLDLPLVGLEHYLLLLQKDGKADKALIEQVKSLIEKKKQEEAAAAAGGSGGSQSNSTIVYEDNVGTGGSSGGGGSPVATPTPTPTASPTPTPTASPTPTPTASPTPTPTASPTPTPTPTPEPVPPTLDLTMFYNHLESYMKNDKTFILPFTTTLALNDSSTNIVKFEVRQDDAGEFESLDIVETVDIHPFEPNQLVVKLKEAVQYGSIIRIKVYENKLKNSETNDVQTNEQVTARGEMEQGFQFINNSEYPPIEFILGKTDYYTNISFKTFGYGMPEWPSEGNSPYIRITRVCPVEGTEECYPFFEYNLSGALQFSVTGPDTAMVMLKGNYFAEGNLRPGAYRLSVSLKNGSNGQVENFLELDITVRVANPPKALTKAAFMEDEYTLVLPFTTSLAFGNYFPKDGLIIYKCDAVELPEDRTCRNAELPLLNITDIESVAVDQDNQTQLIVKLKDPIAYNSNIDVYVKPNAWKNPVNDDFQENEQHFSLNSKVTAFPDYVDFENRPDIVKDKELFIYTHGYELGEIIINGYFCAEEASCFWFEDMPLDSDAYELENDGEYTKLILKGSYFSMELARGEGNITIPIMKKEEQIDEIIIPFNIIRPITID
ncbi:FecR domain-containing protein [Paenibacillus sp. MCAF9]|uniref:FecR family protein n=1 Tax=Paenibacillus sp. MCAF9 TaxID=3233046 RepID=UPI003F9E7489